MTLVGGCRMFATRMEPMTDISQPKEKTTEEREFELFQISIELMRLCHGVILL
jgi:hypothetical protein